MYLNIAFLITVNLMILQSNNFNGINRYTVQDFKLLSDIADRVEPATLSQLFNEYKKATHIKASFETLYAYFMPLFKRADGEKVKE